MTPVPKCIVPPDPLCRWIPELNRYETMQELASILEREWLAMPGTVLPKRPKHPPAILRGYYQNRKQTARVRRMMQLATGRAA